MIFERSLEEGQSNDVTIQRATCAEQRFNLRLVQLHQDCIFNGISPGRRKEGTRNSRHHPSA